MLKPWISAVGLSVCVLLLLVSDVALAASPLSSVLALVTEFAADAEELIWAIVVVVGLFVGFMVVRRHPRAMEMLGFYVVGALFLVYLKDILNWLGSSFVD